MGEHALAVLPLCLAIDASTARSPVLRLATSPPHLCDQSLLIPAFLCTSLASPGRDALAEGEVRPKPAPMFCSMRRLTLCDGKNTDARAKGMTEHLQTHVSDFSVVLFQPHFMLASKKHPMKVHKNQRLVSLLSPTDILCGATNQGTPHGVWGADAFAVP